MYQLKAFDTKAIEEINFSKTYKKDYYDLHKVTHPIDGVKFIDSKTLLTWRNFHDVSVWSLEKKKKYCKILSKVRVCDVFIDEDERILILALDTGIIRVLSLSNYKTIACFDTKLSYPYKFIPDPNEKHFMVIGSQGYIYLYNYKKRVLIKKIEKYSTYTNAILRNAGEYVLFDFNGKIALFSVANLQITNMTEIKGLSYTHGCKTSTENVVAIDYYAERVDQNTTRMTIALLDINSFKILKTIPITGIAKLAFSKTLDRLLVLDKSGYLRVIDPGRNSHFEEEEIFIHSVRNPEAMENSKMITGGLDCLDKTGDIALSVYRYDKKDDSTVKILRLEDD